MRTLTRNVAFVAAMTLALLGTAVAPATAAPGDAFDPARPTIFINQGSPSQLKTASIDVGGDFVLTNEGGPLAGESEYNAIGFNTADNFIYGIASAPIGAIPTGALVKIGQDGVVVGRIGAEVFIDPDGDNTALQVGAFGPGGFLYAADTTGDSIYVIDVTDGSLEANPAITGGSLGNTLVSDWAFSQGYLWGVGEDFTIVRVDPATGALVEFEVTAGEVSPGFAGAAWTYADGALGFSHNISGRIDRIEVTNPASAEPTFTLVESRGGPANSRNDGAASPGLPVDLAVTKTSEGFAAGETVTYTITVTNNGEGWSTGWGIFDDVPSELSDVAADSADADCVVTGNEVECEGGELEPGASATVTVTASVADDQTEDVENSVEVAGNEPDPVASNNTDSVVDSVDPTDDPDVPASPSVPAGGEGSAGPSFGLLGGLGLLGVATLGGGALLRRRLI